VTSVDKQEVLGGDRPDWYQPFSLADVIKGKK
jgi:hypothetical protein